MRIVLFSFLAVFSVLASDPLDCITCKNGLTMSGTIVSQDDAVVILKVKYGTINIPREKIQSIEKESSDDIALREQKESEAPKKEAIKLPKKKETAGRIKKEMPPTEKIVLNGDLESRTKQLAEMIKKYDENRWPRTSEMNELSRQLGKERMEEKMREREIARGESSRFLGSNPTGDERQRRAKEESNRRR